MQSQRMKSSLLTTQSFSECLKQSHQLPPVLMAIPISNNDSVKEVIYMNLFVQTLINMEFKDCKLDRFCEGNLNGDGKDDLFVIASKPCGEHESVDDYSICYRSMIFLAEGSLQYSFSASNDNIIECSNCEHASPTIKISDNKLFITQHLGSCQRDDITRTYEYRRSDNSWYLTKMETISFNCNDHLNTKESTQTEDDFGVIKF